MQLSKQVGLRGPTDSHGPRLYDLRHRFAVSTELCWYRDGVDSRAPSAPSRHLHRACSREQHLLVPHGPAATAVGGHPASGAERAEAPRMKLVADLARLLAAFSTDRLMQQRQASPHTIASCRDTFRLLVRHAQRELRQPPTNLQLAELDTPFLGAFLSHPEKTLHSASGGLPRRRRSRVRAGEPGHADASRAPRPHPAARGAADRAAGWARNCSGCGARMSISGRVPMCTARARDASSAALRFGRTPQRRCGPGSTNSASTRPRPSSRSNVAASSATTAWRTCWRSIWLLPGSPAPRSARSVSHPVSSAT